MSPDAFWLIWSHSRWIPSELARLGPFSDLKIMFLGILAPETTLQKENFQKGLRLKITCWT